MSNSSYLKKRLLSVELRLINNLKVVLMLFFLTACVAPNLVFAGNKKMLISTHSENISVPVFSVETRKNFDDVMEDLLVAIADNNFRLTQHAHIGKAIADRNNITFPSATVVHFCNLNYAKQLLELAPDYLLRMPCRISVWPNSNGSSIINVWLLPEDDKRTIDFAKKINAILKNIVTYSAS